MNGNSFHCTLSQQMCELSLWEQQTSMTMSIPPAKLKSMISCISATDSIALLIVFMEMLAYIRLSSLVTVWFPFFFSAVTHVHSVWEHICTWIMHNTLPLMVMKFLFTANPFMERNNEWSYGSLSDICYSVKNCGRIRLRSLYKKQLPPMRTP